MFRIFCSLSVFAIGLLTVDLVIGLTGPDYNGLSQAYREILNRDGTEETTAAADAEAIAESRAQLEAAQPHVRVHMLLGILAAVVIVLVQSVGVTYFIGTGRWCKEVVETYELDESWVQRANRVKRGSFPWALCGMGTVLAMAAFGAASDPGTLSDNTAAWVVPHYWLGLGGTFVIAACLCLQARSIACNQQVIEGIMAEVRDVRERRGLAVEVG